MNEANNKPIKTNVENIQPVEESALKIIAIYQRNLNLGRDEMGRLFEDVHRYNLSLEEYRLIERQLTDAKSMFTHSKNQQIDFGIGEAIGLHSIALKSKYDELIRFYNEALNELNEYEKVVSRLIERETRLTFDEIFYNTRTKELCIELLEDLEITVEGKPNNLTRFDAGKIAGAIIAMKKRFKFFKTDFTEAQLLKYFSDFLETPFKRYRKNTRQFREAYEDSDDFLKKRFNK